MEVGGLEIGELRESGKPVPCAFCHAPVGSVPIICERCGTQLHRDCIASLKTCPTLGCGSLPLDTRKAARNSTPPRRRRRVVVGALLAVAATCMVYSPLRLIAQVLPLPIEQAPGKWHLRWTDEKKLLSACRALMQDARTHGAYGAVPPPAPGQVARFPEVHSLSELPSEIASMGASEVVVSSDSVTLTWNGVPAYPYGYGLILLKEGADGGDLRRRDHSFCRNIELSEGIWSYWLFH